MQTCFNKPDYVQVSAGESDRLVDPSNIPQEVPVVDVLASDDIFDVENNPIAQHFDQMTHNASTQIRQEAIQNMNDANQTTQPGTDAPANYYFCTKIRWTQRIPPKIIQLLCHKMSSHRVQLVHLR
jgi:hypothetical protein